MGRAENWEKKWGGEGEAAIVIVGKRFSVLDIKSAAVASRIQVLHFGHHLCDIVCAYTHRVTFSKKKNIEISHLHWVVLAHVKERNRGGGEGILLRI